MFKKLNLYISFGFELLIFNGVITSKFYSIDHDLSKLDRGIYFIKVISEGNVLLTDKLILDK